MKVWSVSPYFGERDVAEIKMHEQGPEVDVFCFLESDHDHQGNPRPTSRPETLPTAPEGVQLRHEVRPMLRAWQAWDRERWQRAQLLQLMPELRADDLVIVSDLDEVLSARTIRKVKAGLYGLPAQIAFQIYPYRLDWRWTTPVGSGGCQCTVATGEQVMEHGTDGVVKTAKATVVIDPGAGWHFTYQGTPEAIAAKARSIADGWTATATTEDAQRSIGSGVDLFGRDRPVETVPLRELPAYVQRNRAKFSHLLRGGEHGQEHRKADDENEASNQAQGDQGQKERPGKKAGTAGTRSRGGA